MAGVLAVASFYHIICIMLNIRKASNHWPKHSNYAFFKNSGFNR